MAVIVGTGSIFLALTLTVNIIALLVPYWANMKANTLNNRGLWGSCRCDWSDFENFASDAEDAVDDGDNAWFMAVKSLYSIAVFFILIGLLIVFIVSCCTKASKGILVAGIFLIIATVLIIVALVLFGVMGNDKWGLELSGYQEFSWGFWLGVAGCILCLLTSIIYIHQGRGGAYVLVEH